MLWLEFGFPVLADFVFSPGTANPNGSSTGPFLETQGDGPSIRYQQVYAAASFLSFSPVPVSINELSFAQIPGFPVDVNLASIDIRLSTTPSAPDGLSPFFAQNVGADDAVVYSGSLHFFQSTMESYGVHVLLQHPFLYNPQGGNLLLDVRNFQTVPGPPSTGGGLYANIVTGDPVSLIAALNVNAASGPQTTAGLLTRFTVTATPEPSVALLLLLGIVLFTVCRRKKPNHNTSTAPELVTKINEDNEEVTLLALLK